MKAKSVTAKTAMNKIPGENNMAEETAIIVVVDKRITQDEFNEIKTKIVFLLKELQNEYA